MIHITLSSLALALADLLTRRLAALESFEAGKASVKSLTLRRDQIEALPPELRGRPLADELSAADARHDGFGAVVWFHVEAVLRHPDSTPEMVAAARKIRAAFIPALDVLQARYDVEASAAKAHEPLLAELKTELMMFPVHTGGTLHDVAVAYVGEGKKIDALLSDRADTKDRKRASALRNELLSKLTRLREDLAEARKDDPSLPADLEDQVFGYLDLLNAKDADAATEQKKRQAARREAAAKQAPDPAP
ncbi:MAG: hypothetical protein QM820_16250 [Minicystis sp.]